MYLLNFLNISGQSRRTVAFTILGIVVLCCAVYVRVLGFEFVRWDDGMLVYENPAIRSISPATLTWIFTHFDPELYIPLTFFSYQLNYLIGGVGPFIYHLTNLLLQACNAVLLLFVVERVTGKWRVAVLTALLFALHPLNTEAVAWVSGRKDLLSLFFALSSILAFLQYEMSGKRWTYWLSVVLFTCGLLSKVMVATVPGILFLIAYLEGRPMDRAWFKSLSPFLVLSILFAGIAFVGKQALVAATPWPMRIFMATKSTVFYVLHIVWPVRFSVLYPYTGEANLLSPEFIVSIGAIVAILVLAFFLRNRARFFLFSVLFYLGTLIPTYFNVGTKSEMDVYFASDRYAYLPSIAIFFLIASAFDVLCETLQKRSSAAGSRAFVVTSTVVVAILCVLSYRQSLVWSDTETLFQNVIRDYPDASHVAYNNLCNMKRLENDLPAAVELCKKAIAIRPHPKTWSNLGAVYRLQNDMSDALDAYAQALALDPQSPDAHFGLALVKQQQGDYAAADKEYRTTIALNPPMETMEGAKLDLGSLLVKEGKLEDAVTQYRAALAINPFYPQAFYNLGVVLTQLGRLDEAVAAYQQSAILDPKNIPTYINLGVLYAKLGKLEDSRAQFQTILRIDPANATALSAMKQLGNAQ